MEMSTVLRRRSRGFFVGIVAVLVAGAVALVAATIAARTWRSRRSAGGLLLESEKAPASESPQRRLLSARKATGTLTSAAILPTVGASVSPLATDPTGNPPPEQAARERAGRLVAELERSGPTSGGWTDAARKAIQDWSVAGSERGGIDVSDFHCFEQGCTAIATFPDRNAYFESKRANAFPISSWRGPIFASGPFLSSSGRTQISLILYRGVVQ